MADSPILFHKNPGGVPLELMANGCLPVGAAVRRMRRDRQTARRKLASDQPVATATTFNFNINFKPFTASEQSKETEDKASEKGEERKPTNESSDFVFGDVISKAKLAPSRKFCDYCGTECVDGDWPHWFCQKQARSLVDATVKRDVPRLKRLLEERRCERAGKADQQTKEANVDPKNSTDINKAAQSTDSTTHTESDQQIEGTSNNADKDNIGEMIRKMENLAVEEEKQLQAEPADVKSCVQSDISKAIESTESSVEDKSDQYRKTEVSCTEDGSSISDVENVMMMATKEEWGREVTYSLLMAVSMRQLDMVELLLAEGASTHMNDWYPLIITAAAQNSPEILRLLLDHGVDPTLTTPMGSAVHAATRVGSLPIIKILHSFGADLRAKNETEECTPLHYAAEMACTDIVEYLLEHGCDLDPRDQHGSTPLHLASRRGHTDAAGLLLKAGASIDAMDNEHRTAWMNAVEHDHPEVLCNMLQNIKKDGEIMLQSCRAGAVKCVRNLLKQGKDCGLTSREGVTPLMEAVKNGHRLVVECLLTEGQMKCDVNTRSQRGESALSLALSRPLIHSDTEKTLRLLVSHDADVDRNVNEEGKTLLMEHLHDIEKRDWLLAHGANPSRVVNGCSVLSVLANSCGEVSYEESKDMLDTLINLNIDLRISAQRDTSLRTPLQTALEKDAVSLAWDMFRYGFSLAYMSTWLSETFSEEDPDDDDLHELLDEVRTKCQYPPSLAAHCRLTILPTLGHFISESTYSLAPPRVCTPKASTLHEAVQALPLPSRLQQYLLPWKFV